MTEFEQFKEFFDKYGVEYDAGNYTHPDDKSKSYINILGTYFEFKRGVFLHITEPEFDTIVERIK